MPDATTPHHPSEGRHAPFSIGLVVVLCVLLGLVAGGAATWLWLERQVQQASGQQLLVLEQKVQQLRLELDIERARANELHGQLVVERSTIKGLESALGAAQSDLGAANDKLAFYDQLLPPGPQGSVGIRALEIFPVGPNLLQYRLLLARNAQGRKPFEGRLQFMARGVQREPAPAVSAGAAQGGAAESAAALPGRSRTVTLELFPARAGSSAGLAGEAGPDTADPAPAGQATAAVAPAAALVLAFDQFQRSEGVLGVPPGFTPDHITVNVLEDGRVRASTTLELTSTDLL